MNIEFNPKGQDSRYLAALNSCFGSWGGEREYDWYLRRSFAGHTPDRMVISEGDEWIAGSAITWRLLLDTQGTQRLVGIMTGSWTLPAARGRGCFKAMIEASRERCSATGAAWLMAFVTADNASRRVLEGAGSQMIRARYLWSADNASVPSKADELRVIEPSGNDIEDAWRRGSVVRTDRRGFFYPDAAHWADQFVHRPLATELLESDRGRMVVERHPVFDRVIATLCDGQEQRLRLEQAACERALAGGRRFFTFTTLIDHAEELVARCGLGGTEGYITLLPAAQEKPAEGSSWFVESGDRV